MNTQQTWVDQRLRRSLQSFLPNLYSLIAFSGRGSLNKSIKANFTLADPKILDAADRWLINVTRMHAVLKAQGVRYYVFLSQLWDWKAHSHHQQMAAQMKSCSNKYQKLISKR